jgi:2-dehydro-3-deoxy-L-rhamnonate dehydrogenase (NAD+)
MTAAKDLAPHHIRVNTVLPALIGPEEAYMWKRQNQLHAASGSPYFARSEAEVGANKINGVPMKRLGTVEEVVSAVDYLLSDESSYITGTSLVVAGGLA